MTKTTIGMTTGVVAAAIAVGSASTASGQEAVQWRVEDGGNGHWYRGIANGAPICWTEARDAAVASGGHLATLTSSSEDAWVCERIVQVTPGMYPPGCGDGPMIGGFKISADDWQWVTGEPFAYSNWVYENGAGMEMIQFFAFTCGWDGTGYCGGFCGGNFAYLVEWSADCNGDGIVDYGQIRAGELDDLNGNNVPDCCEDDSGCTPCPSDVVEDGIVNAIDLASVLSYWGTNGGKLPRSDVDGNGTVDALDLARVLSDWGPCP